MLLAAAGLLVLLPCSLDSASAPGSGTQVPPVPPAASTRLVVRNTTRLERWRFFEPHPGGGEPDYAFLANRLLVGVRHVRPRWEAQVAGQYVQFGGLPERASGPGPLGTGGAYYDASGTTTSRGVYVKTLNVKLKGLARRLNLQVGRFGYASGAEAYSGVSKIETVKRQRIDSRLIGEFEWSIYQRSFDGVRGDWLGAGWQVTVAGFRPTQGGFEEQAGVHIPEVNVLVGAVSARPGVWIPNSDTQVFVYQYRDRREVRARPDNSGAAAASAEIDVTTFGGTVVGAARSGRGEVDVLAWAALQAGDWYGEAHRAWALALEAGHQWTEVAWRPWLRGGVGLSSGDDDPSDSRHGTFFQMLPTARKYAQSTVYTQMNLVDVFAQFSFRPRAAIGIRADVHQLGLMQSADRWYFGSGVTQRRGTGFGYGSRTSGGQTQLGTIAEGSVEWSVGPRWSLNAYAGWMRGGDVVRGQFAGHRLTFAYLENVIAF